MRRERKVGNGNVWLNLRDMRMSVNVLRGALMDCILLHALEIKVFGFGRVS